MTQQSDRLTDPAGEPVASQPYRAARLPRTYDEQRLLADLQALKGMPQAPQTGPYHDGDWTGILLYAPGGGTAEVEHPQLEHPAPTPALDVAPYLAELLAELPAPKLLARLLVLPPGAEIGEHNDCGSSFQFGSLRLHVPLVTHDQVVMVVDGERMRWKPGELWWGDFARRHWLRNDSRVTRVHLVVDLQVCEDLLALFPAEVVAAQEEVGTGIARYVPPLPPQPGSDAELAAFASEFELPARLMPLFAGEGSLAELARDAIGVARPAGGRLVVTLDGTPSFALERIGRTSFSVVGLPPGVRVEFDDAMEPTAAEVIVRGLPTDLYAAQLGFQSGPVIPEQRFRLPLRRPV